MTRGHYRVIAAAMVIAAIAVAGTVVRPAGRMVRTAAGGVAPVGSSTVVCPNVSGGPGGLTTDMMVAHVTSGASPKVQYSVVRTPGERAVQHLAPAPLAVVHKDAAYGAVAVTATGPGSDGVTASQTGLIPGGIGRGLLDTACRPTATDSWFVGADGRIGFSDWLYLVNPSDTIANVALSFWSGRGPLSPPNTSGIPLPAHTTMLRKISDFAPDVAALALRVHANSGAVAAAVVDLQSTGTTPRGSDWIPVTSPPARSAVVTGFFAHATLDVVDIANPGDRDATVSLRVLTPSKNFVPAGHQTVVVPAGHTVTVDVSGAVAGEAAAVALTSDDPVAASGFTAQTPSSGFRDLTWLGAEQPLRGPAGVANNVPPFAQAVHLMLTAPDASARVRVSTVRGSSAVVTVPSGRTFDIDLQALLHAGAGGPGPLLLTPLDLAAVYAVRTMYAVGAHGPLLAASTPLPLPRPTVLPPVVADIRAALA